MLEVTILISNPVKPLPGQHTDLDVLDFAAKVFYRQWVVSCVRDGNGLCFLGQIEADNFLLDIFLLTEVTNFIRCSLAMRCPSRPTSSWLLA
jgi:hypothetical protein